MLVLRGGGIGSLARYAAGMAITERLGSRFPVGARVISGTGSLVIGFILTVITERLPGDLNRRPRSVTGFLGGYATFSGFEREAYVANVLGSVIPGAAAAAPGVVHGQA